jgi:hypothetical protein
MRARLLSIALIALLPLAAAPQRKSNLTPAADAGPHIGSCPVFPRDNVWNTPVDKLPKDANSDIYIESIGLDKPLHPDFGEHNNGIPYVLVPAAQKRVRLQFDNKGESDLSSYPIPPNAPIEGGGDPKGDRHVIVIDKDRCVLFETFAASANPDGTWHVGSAAIFDLMGNGLRPYDRTSADAAGLPIFPGLVRYDEVEAGEIRHALRFTTRQTRREYIWPARHFASKLTDKRYPPMGIRVRLKADFDISGFSPTNQVILRALKKYGMILADNGAPMFVQGAPDDRWSDADLHNLTKVHATDFEVVDEGGWWFMPDSGRVDPTAVKK